MRPKPFSPSPLLAIALATGAGMVSTTMVADMAARLVSPGGQTSVAPADATPVDPLAPLPRHAAASEEPQLHPPIVTPG